MLLKLHICRKKKNPFILEKKGRRISYFYPYENKAEAEWLNAFVSGKYEDKATQ